MKHILHLVAADLVVERPDGSQEDVHFPRALAQAVIEAYSSPGETVLDPFAGWGTTLLVAETLGRSAVGVELVTERVAAIKQRVSASAVVLEADARDLDSLHLGQIDLCFTSPPYMTAVEHPQNPLTGYSTLDGNYDTYLTELTGVFLKVASHVRTGGHLVINAANICHGPGRHTTGLGHHPRTDPAPGLSRRDLSGLGPTATLVHRRLLPDLPENLTNRSSERMVLHRTRQDSGGSWSTPYRRKRMRMWRVGMRSGGRALPLRSVGGRGRRVTAGRQRRVGIGR